MSTCKRRRCFDCCPSCHRSSDISAAFCARVFWESGDSRGGREGGGEAAGQLLGRPAGDLLPALAARAGAPMRLERLRGACPLVPALRFETTSSPKQRSRAQCATPAAHQPEPGAPRCSPRMAQAAKTQNACIPPGDTRLDASGHALNFRLAWRANATSEGMLSDRLISLCTCIAATQASPDEP
jgi:hypothetical protein